MSDSVELPALPKRERLYPERGNAAIYGYTADQMHAFYTEGWKARDSALRVQVPDGLLQLIRDSHRRIGNDGAIACYPFLAKNDATYGPLLKRLNEMAAALASLQNAEEKTLPQPTRVHILDHCAVVVGTPQKGWGEEGDDAHNCDAEGCSSIGPHVLYTLPVTDGRKAASPAAPQSGKDDRRVREWIQAFHDHLLSWGLKPEIAKALANAEREEISAGECDCLNETPEDVAEWELDEIQNALKSRTGRHSYAYAAAKTSSEARDTADVAGMDEHLGFIEYCGDMLRKLGKPMLGSSLRHTAETLRLRFAEQPKPDSRGEGNTNQEGTK